MALADIYSRTRSVLYGTGLGSKPSLRRAASNAAETTSGDTCTFALLAGEGDKVKAGQVLSVWDPDAEADAHAFYVLSVATDTVTAVNGYDGSPAIAGSDSGDLDNKILEQNPLVTGYQIFEAIDTVISRLLWPYVYQIETKTVTSPDLVDGQEAVAADVKEIISAWQVIGPDNLAIAFDPKRPLDVNTSQKSTGKMVQFDWIDGSTGYYTAKTKLVEADEASVELTHLIAVGAAAICLGASISETAMDATKKDNVEAASRRQQVADRLWRDFLTLRQGHQLELERDTPNVVHISRG